MDAVARREQIQTMKSKKYEPPKYEFPVHDINWTTGAGKPAGVYWLEGRSVIAAHDSAAERALLEIGAILIATLRFEPDPLETTQRGRTVDRVHAPQLVAELFLSAIN